MQRSIGRLRAGGSGSLALFNLLTNPSQPTPYFIEGWAQNSFNGVVNNAPTASGIPTDSIGQLKLEYTVSGSAGASTLTISAGDVSLGTGIWGGVIQHDSGTYGIYTIYNVSGASASCYPPLGATVTSKTLRNLQGAVNGQHYTDVGYRALANKVYATTKGSAYRLRYASKWEAANGITTDWTITGGLGGGQYSLATANQFNNFGSIARGRRMIQAIPTSPYTGKGVTKSFNLIPGRSGNLEAFLSCTTTTANASFRARAFVDGSSILDLTLSADYGLYRLQAPYTGGTTGVLTITRAAEEAGSFSLNIGDVTWGAYDRSETWTDSVINKNGKVVVLGDSWTTFYAASGSQGVFCTQLQDVITADGGSGTVVGVGQAGQTAEWGLANFDSLVTPEAPSTVVILFFTNDQNAYGVDGYERWLRAMYRIGLKCQAIGANPVFVMPQPTASFSQSVNHGVWTEKIGAGLPI